MSIHNPSFRPKCNMCRKEFNNKGNLKRHFNFHCQAAMNSTSINTKKNEEKLHSVTKPGNENSFNCTGHDKRFNPQHLLITHQENTHRVTCDGNNNFCDEKDVFDPVIEYLDHNDNNQ